jgi:iron(III) transport system substrate-binding protein
MGFTQSSRLRSISLLAAAAVVTAACSSNSGSGSASSAAATTAGQAPTNAAAPSSAASTSSSASGSAGAFSYSKTAEDACAAAASEGALNYVSQTDPLVFAQEIKPFQEKYPGIKINFTQLHGVDAVQRIVAEAQANHPFDIDAVNLDLGAAAPLFQDKLVKNVDYAKLGVPSDRLLAMQGVSTWRVYRDPQGIAYNTDLVKPSDLPDTWDGLVDAKYAGKIIVDPRALYVAGLAQAWGQDKAISWLENFLKVDKAVVVEGASSGMQKVASGQVAMTTSATYSAFAPNKEKGAPIGLKYLDLVPTFEFYSVILEKAQHPNAAACFASWFSGSEGDAAQLKYEYKQTASHPNGVPASAKILSVTSEETAALYSDTSAKMSKLIH